MSGPGFTDLFSGHAAEYAMFRPRYPAALYDWLASIAPGKELAWDAGTGSGQVAHGLVTRFARVVATDPSSAQIAQAAPHPRIRFGVTTYESGIPDGGAQLVTVGQALHWFDLGPFFTETRRVLRPEGKVAAFAYAHSRVTPEVDSLVRAYHDVTVGAYWAPAHHLIHAGYRTLELPIVELAAPAFEIVEQWTLLQYAGFLRTWSSVQRLIAEEGDAKVLAFEAALAERWGDAPVRAVLWPLVLRVGTLA